MTLLKLEWNRLFYNGNLCLPRTLVSTILQMAHGSRLAGHLNFKKKMSHLNKFHWQQKSRDVKNYIQRCIKGQQFEDSNQKRMTDPISLEMPERRCGSIATDFNVSLPTTQDGFDSILTW